jgi:hypothetical protein
MLVADDGRTALIRCVGPKEAGIGEQRVELHRPSQLTVTRHCTQLLTWWCAGEPTHKENTVTWANGTMLTLKKGNIVAMKPDGFVETKVHFGGMKFADPHPFTYPTFTVEPQDGQIALEVVCPTDREHTANTTANLTNTGGR